jgi:lipopolysaccharide export LptBFGC system permease protein LptF
MERDNQAENTGNWLHSVLTDIQFWVPVAVLIAGLLLLHSLH